MKGVITAGLSLAVVALLVVAAGVAQEPRTRPSGGRAAPSAAESTDPRVGLRGGYQNPGVAARHMELVANVPRPPGFYDPKAPAGLPTPAERPTDDEEEEPPAAPARPGGPPQRGRLDFAHTDLAFRGNVVFVGNFSGIMTYDIATPRNPRLIASLLCPGGQGDVSVHGNLLFMSVEETRGRLDCGTQGVPEPVSAERFRGVRIFDISDVRNPTQVAAVQTCRGSHTHTLLVDPKDSAHVYIYGSGTGTVRSSDELAGCAADESKENLESALFSIDVIQVPLAAPQNARVVNRPRIFSDPATGAIAGLWQGGDHGPGTQKTSVTDRCHDITVFPERGLAAGACSGNGILLDISDPVNPVRIDQVVDPGFAFWHSATFNNDGTKVVFTDEWGGGTRPRCRATDPPTWGANAIFDIVDRKLQYRSHYKLPAPQTEVENCVAHNGSIVPVPGRDIMVQAWYQGGTSVFDFTDSANPVEIAFFDRGPVDPKQLITAGHWSSYWYNGHIYATEIARGLDVFRLVPSEHLSANELEAARLVRWEEFNPQQQPRATWPASPVVARAYLDQLTRSQAIPSQRAAALTAALDRPEAAGLTALAAELKQEADRAAGIDARRLEALAGVLGQIASGK